MEISTLTMYNDWWITGRPRKELVQPHHRPIFEKIMSFIDDRQIILLYGLRRVGKTTIIYQIIDKLLNDGVPRDRILYFSFDENNATIDELLRIYSNEVLRTNLDKAGKLYIILDEIQKETDWENRTKIYYDLYPNIKFIISGSASLNIKKKSSETLAGRLYSFLITPLDFREFLELRGIRPELTEWRLYSKTIEPLVMDYALKGGFPELVHENNTEKIATYVKEIVLDRILLVDIPQEFGIRDISLMRTIVELIASNPGFIINYDSLSKKLGRSKQTLMNYFFYLEYSLIIGTVQNMRPGFLSTSRKMKKAYFSSSAFQLALRRQNYTDRGKLYGSIVFQSVYPDRYYREGNEEIDFILLDDKEITPLEVKSGNFDLKKFTKLLEKLDLSSGIIISDGEFRIYKEDGITVKIIPLWLFILFPTRISELS